MLEPPTTTPRDVVRLTITLPAETNLALRRVLAEKGLAKKGGMSDYITEVLKRQILIDSLRDFGKNFAHLSPDEREALAAEAVAAARAELRPMYQEQFGRPVS